MFIFTKLISVVLFSDFISGLIHWLEDTYAKPGMPLVSKIAEENELHHTKPREFLKKNWWQSSWDIALAGLLIVVSAWWLKALSWAVMLFAFLVTNANQVHKWSHKNRNENGAFVRLLHKLNILQSPKHHAMHHSGAKNTHYCVLTNFLNPMLEKFNFWRKLERFNSLTFGLKPNNV